MDDLKRRLARLLLEKSYKEGSFVLASGRTSDYYFDCRQTALHPEGAWLIGNLLFDIVKDLSIAGVGGPTLGADPLVSAVSVISYEKGRPLPGFLVRKESKGHGTNNYIEGLANFKAGDSIALLEDVVTSGGSGLTACSKVEAAGMKVAAVVSIMDREEGGREKMAEQGYRLISLFTRKELLACAAD